MESADIFKKYLKPFLQQHKHKILPRQTKVIQNIMACRTYILGGQKFYCPDCDQYHNSFKSCGDRHCPKCQHEKSAQWFEKMKNKMLNCPYFMVTFTIPKQLRIVFLNHQKLMYNLFFNASKQALLELAADPRFLSGKIAMIGVLQTWAKALIYHPHIHYLVTGGALSFDQRRWIYGKHDFLVHYKPLEKLFKGIFRQLLQKEKDIYQLVPKDTWNKEWRVNLKPVGNGLNILKYLAAYMFRVAIANHNILDIKEDKVLIRYKDNGPENITPTKFMQPNLSGDLLTIFYRNDLSKSDISVYLHHGIKNY